MKNISWTNRNEYIQILTEKFFIYLQGQYSLFITDQDAYNADKEGRTKYLSNLDLYLKKHNKYLTGDWYSKEAYEKVKNKDYKNLIYEHIVPKNIYQNEIFNLMKTNKFTKDKLFDILNKYWVIAIITEEQDKLLNTAGLRTKIPDNELNNIFARYDRVGIKLCSLTFLNENN